jgi:hypothetical protein
MKMGIGVMLIVLAAFPLIHPYLSTLFRSQVSASSTTDPTTKPDISLPPNVLLGYGDLTLQSLRVGNYTRAQLLLRYMDNLPSNTESNLRTYLNQIAALASDLGSISNGLDQLKQFVQNGQISLARQNVTQLEVLLDVASSRIDLLSFALARIEALYGIDVSQQRRYLDDMRQLLQGFRQTLAIIEAELQSLDKRLATEIIIEASPNPLWVNETLNVQGQLRQVNGTGLSGRSVSLWVNQIQVGNVTVDANGTLSWTYLISARDHPDTLALFASFVPTGQDVYDFRPTTSPTVSVKVDYYHVLLTAAASTDKVHVLERVLVHGRLSDQESNALSNATIWLLLDDKPVDSSQTDLYGDYTIGIYLPANATGGSHDLYVRFSPVSGIYSPTESQKIKINLYYLNSAIELYGRTNSSLNLSGQLLSIDGVLTVDARPFAKGLILVLEGEQELGRTFSDANGTFNVPLRIPFVASGLTMIRVLFIPNVPWVLSKITTVVLNVLNSGVIGLGVSVLAAAVVTISRGTFQRLSTTRRRKYGDQTTLMELELTDEISPTYTLYLVRLRRLHDPRVCVRETYWEVRRLLSITLREGGKSAETHREFEARVESTLLDYWVSSRIGYVSSAFHMLTLQFEVAEYSPRIVLDIEANDAIKCAILVAEGLNARVEYGKDWRRFVGASKKAAVEVLRKRGLTPTGISIDPQKAIVEIPWYIGNEKRSELNSALELALHIPTESLQIRLCDRCGFKMKGGEISKHICPRCGSKFEDQES